MEKARGMFSGTILAQEFWVDTMDISCYFVN